MLSSLIVHVGDWKSLLLNLGGTRAVGVTEEGVVLLVSASVEEIHAVSTPPGTRGAG